MCVCVNVYTDTHVHTLTKFERRHWNKVHISLSLDNPLMRNEVVKYEKKKKDSDTKNK